MTRIAIRLGVIEASAGRVGMREEKRAKNEEPAEKERAGLGQLETVVTVASAMYAPCDKGTREQTADLE